jgi:hypothetical protein
LGSRRRYTGGLLAEPLGHATCTSHPRPHALPWLDLGSSKRQPPRSTFTACATLHANTNGRYVPSRPFQQDLRQGHNLIRPIREIIRPIREIRADAASAYKMLTTDVHTLMARVRRHRLPTYICERLALHRHSAFCSPPDARAPKTHPTGADRRPQIQRVCRPTRHETFPAGRTTIFTGLKSATRMDPYTHNNEAFFTQTSFLDPSNVVQAPMYYTFSQRCVIRSDHPVYRNHSFPFHAPNPLVTSRPGRLLADCLLGSRQLLNNFIR